MNADQDSYLITVTWQLIGQLSSLVSDEALGRVTDFNSWTDQAMKDQLGHHWTLLDEQEAAAHLCAQVRPGSSSWWCGRAMEAGLPRGRPVTGWTAPLIDRSLNISPPGWAASEAGPLCREGAGSRWGLKRKGEYFQRCDGGAATGRWHKLEK